MSARNYQQREAQQGTAGRDRRRSSPAVMEQSPQVSQLAALEEQANQNAGVLQAAHLGEVLNAPAQRKASNSTGLGGDLQSGLEQLSGIDLSGVRVHYNSPKPAQLQALAYAQGQDIHVAPGQEQHLPHEGWHVVQQMQGRVAPTMDYAGTAINDDAGLEREADVMGDKALQRRAAPEDRVAREAAHASAVTQRIVVQFVNLESIGKDLEPSELAGINLDMYQVHEGTGEEEEGGGGGGLFGFFGE